MLPEYDFSSGHAFTEIVEPFLFEVAKFERLTGETPTALMEKLQPALLRTGAHDASQIQSKLGLKAYDILNNWKAWRCTILSLAFQYKLWVYLGLKLGQSRDEIGELKDDFNGRPLLDFALQDPTKISASLVKVIRLLLSKGADPNEIMSEGQRHSGLRRGDVSV